MSSEFSDLITTREAAELIGVDVATVRGRIRYGKLPAYKLVGRVRVRRADVVALLKPMSDAPQMEPPEVKMVRDAETRATLARHRVI